MLQKQLAEANNRLAKLQADNQCLRQRLEKLETQANRSDAVSPQCTGQAATNADRQQVSCMLML